MIAHNHRFHGRGSLNYVYQKGAMARTDGVSIRYIQSRRSDYRLAVVVSKKVSKSAVTRNRIRRRIYEAVRRYKKDYNAVWPYDMVISVFDERTATMPAEQLEQVVHRILQKSALQGSVVE